MLAQVLLLALAPLGPQVQAQDRRNLAVAPVATEAAASDKRVALVIGNSQYQKGPLRNPVNDAADMAAKLRALGFDVVERTDIKTSQIGRTLREFRSRLTPGSVALFFYAGHGLQIKGENYLPAVDADIEGEEDAPNQSIAVRQVMDIMEDAKTRLNLAFLDACRNNPYARSFRSGADGLARISAPSGTLISFATRPGSVAADGSGRNGLYTTHLLKAIETPNQPVELMLKQVTSGVKVASRGQQEPWMEGSIEGDFQFRTVAAQHGDVISAADAERERQKAVDRAVQEALSRSNEQAARERAELQASMQRLIQEALARQGPKNNGSPSHAAAPQVVASLGPSPQAAATRPLAFEPGKAPQPGDEWEYLVREELFGMQKRLLWRVRASDASVGVLEELLVDGQPMQQRAFNGAPNLVGVPTDAGIFFGPHWTGSKLADLKAEGVGDCAVRWGCVFKPEVEGKERVSISAGTFDAIRIKGRLIISANITVDAGEITVWYSASDQRLLKQVVRRQRTMTGLGPATETTELQAVRLTAR